MRSYETFVTVMEAIFDSEKCKGCEHGYRVRGIIPTCQSGSNYICKKDGKQFAWNEEELLNGVAR